MLASIAQAPSTGPERVSIDLDEDPDDPADLALEASQGFSHANPVQEVSPVTSESHAREQSQNSRRLSLDPDESLGGSTCLAQPSPHSSRRISLDRADSFTGLVSLAQVWSQTSDRASVDPDANLVGAAKNAAISIRPHESPALGHVPIFTPKNVWSGDRSQERPSKPLRYTFEESDE